MRRLTEPDGASLRENSSRILPVLREVFDSVPVLSPFNGEINLFITPGFEFHIVDALITNFHLPKSTLLMLISAFAGRERVLAAYEEAKTYNYKFFSFGDAMLII